MSEAPPTANATVRRHREMLMVTCAIVVLAFVLDVRPDERVAVRGLPDYPLPHSCFTYSWFGVKCPGCGLTRSFIFLARGDWDNSLRLHRLGWLLAAAVLVQFPYRLTALARPGKPPLGAVLPRLFGYVLIVLLVGNWLVDVLRPVWQRWG